jgi:hypothetical protein
MRLLVSSAKGANGAGYGAILALTTATVTANCRQNFTKP